MTTPTANDTHNVRDANTGLGYAAYTLESEADLKFHPDFTEPKTATIFQASDGTCFRFSWPLLAAISSFFEDLRSLPATPDTTEPAIVPLPSASAPALAFAFCAINSVIFCRGPLDLPPQDSWSDIHTVADAYNLPLVLAALQNVARSENVRLFAQFALAVLAEDYKTMEGLSLPLLKCNIATLYGSWAGNILKEHAPLILIELYHHFANWSNGLDVLQEPQHHFPILVPKDKRECKKCKRTAHPNQVARKLLLQARAALIENPELIVNLRSTYSVDCVECMSHVESRVYATLLNNFPLERFLFEFEL